MIIFEKYRLFIAATVIKMIIDIFDWHVNNQNLQKVVVSKVYVLGKDF